MASAQQAHTHPVVADIRRRLAARVSRVAQPQLEHPRLVAWGALPAEFDFVFLGLHGSPGEDGQVQALLEGLGLPYNGSGSASSQLTMQKYATNEALATAGLRIPAHVLLSQAQVAAQGPAALDAAERALGYPMIAKPADEGCSSAVKKIRHRAQLEAYVRAMLRPGGRIGPAEAEVLSVGPTDEFPAKGEVLLERLVAPEGARLIEVTVGVLTERGADGRLRYTALEPSETLASGEVLSLEEKFLAGEGQNITPARFSRHAAEQARVSALVRAQVAQAAERLGIEGYARLDAFVRMHDSGATEVVFIEANSLPALTPATCLFHQAALAGYTPLGLLERLMAQGRARLAARAT